MAIRQEDLIAMNEQMWAAMLGLPLSATEYVNPVNQGQGSIGACVQLVGEWEGAVRLDCSSGLAELAARRFLGKARSELTVDDLRDTVGELTNMVAGSVKALLPQPTHVSLPSVADGTDYDLTVRGGRVLLQCPFECEGNPMLVSLLERDPDADPLRNSQALKYVQ